MYVIIYVYLKRVTLILTDWNQSNLAVICAEIVGGCAVVKVKIVSINIYNRENTETSAIWIGTLRNLNEFFIRI